jgi:hypothetical protein
MSKELELTVVDTSDGGVVSCMLTWVQVSNEYGGTFLDGSEDDCNSVAE